MRNHDELLIYKKVELLLNRIYPALKNYPQAEKYVLCAEIKKAFINLMKYIMLANKVKSKRQYYQEEADAYLQTCKILMKLSYDQKYISAGFYEDIDKDLAEIGKMLAGWIKNT